MDVDEIYDFQPACPVGTAGLKDVGRRRVTTGSAKYKKYKT